MVFPVVDFFAHELDLRLALRVLLAHRAVEGPALADAGHASADRSVLVRVVAGPATDIAVIQMKGEFALRIQVHVVGGDAPRVRLLQTARADRGAPGDFAGGVTRLAKVLLPQCRQHAARRAVHRMAPTATVGDVQDMRWVDRVMGSDLRNVVQEILHRSRPEAGHGELQIVRVDHPIPIQIEVLAKSAGVYHRDDLRGVVRHPRHARAKRIGAVAAIHHPYPLLLGRPSHSPARLRRPNPRHCRGRPGARDAVHLHRRVVRVRDIQSPGADHHVARLPQVPGGGAILKERQLVGIQFLSKAVEGANGSHQGVGDINVAARIDGHALAAGEPRRLTVRRVEDAIPELELHDPRGVEHLHAEAVHVGDDDVVQRRIEGDGLGGLKLPQPRTLHTPRPGQRPAIGSALRKDHHLVPPRVHGVQLVRPGMQGEVVRPRQDPWGRVDQALKDERRRVHADLSIVAGKEHAPIAVNGDPHRSLGN